MANQMVQNIISKIPAKTQLNWGVRVGSLLKIPLLAFVWPEVQEVGEERSQLQIPISYRTKNHLNVVYFGALCMGAEAVIALHVLDEIRQNGKIDFLFKDFKAQFLKRAESDVVFVCEEGLAIRDMVHQARATKERQSMTFHSYAMTPAKTGSEKVAEFSLTLSVKQR
jgi:acyl-coenzyme A thioesterase PaaI-like protein